MMRKYQHKFLKKTVILGIESLQVRVSYEKFFKQFFNLIDKVYLVILIMFGFYSICCVLFKFNNEINWFEYVGAIAMCFVVIGWIGSVIQHYNHWHLKQRMGLDVNRFEQLLDLLHYKSKKIKCYHQSNLIHAIMIFAAANKDSDLEVFCQSEIDNIRAQNIDK